MYKGAFRAMNNASKGARMLIRRFFKLLYILTLLSVPSVGYAIEAGSCSFNLTSAGNPYPLTIKSFVVTRVTLRDESGNDKCSDDTAGKPGLVPGFVRTAPAGSSSGKGPNLPPCGPEDRDLISSIAKNSTDKIDRLRSNLALCLYAGSAQALYRVFEGPKEKGNILSAWIGTIVSVTSKGQEPIDHLLKRSTALTGMKFIARTGAIGFTCGVIGDTLANGTSVQYIAEILDDASDKVLGH